MPVGGLLTSMGQMEHYMKEKSFGYSLSLVLNIHSIRPRYHILILFAYDLFWINHQLKSFLFEHDDSVILCFVSLSSFSRFYIYWKSLEIFFSCVKIALL